jgi:DNA polymerase-1
MIELPKLARGTPVAVDQETTGGLHIDPPENARVAVVSIAWRGGVGLQRRAFPFAFGQGRGPQLTLDLEPDPNLGADEWRQLLGWLSYQRLVMHPGKFDLLHLWRGTDRWEGIDLRGAYQGDTLLGSRILDPGMEAGLADLEARLDYCEPEVREAWLASKKKRSNVNRMAWAEAQNYAALDAEITLAVYENQQTRFEQGEGDWSGYQQEMRLTRTLVGMERRGIGYNATRSQEIAEELKRVINHIKVGLPFKTTVPGARKYFFIQLKHEALNYTNKGTPQLDDREVARLVELKVPHAAEFQHLRHLETAVGMWYEGYADATGWDGRLRTVYSQGKVVSGRLSATRVNLQAIPQDYQMGDVLQEGFETPRQLFHPKAHSRLWELDLSQAELRVAAQEAKCERMLEMLVQGVDLHGEVARELFHDEPGSPTWNKSRNVGKRGDFAFIFGVGEETFQATLIAQLGLYLPIQECRRIVYAWRKLFPEFGGAIHRYMERANHWGYVRLINGRPRHFQGYEDKHKAFNQYVQGSLAELMKEWLIRGDALYPGIVLLTIHDSMVVETADEEKVHGLQALGERIGAEWFGVAMDVDVKEWG